MLLSSRGLNSNGWSDYGRTLQLDLKKSFSLFMFFFLVKFHNRK